MITALTRIFGVHHLALAEDVTQDALCRAMAVWPYSGIPDDPAAWLLTVAKNRALDILRKEKNAQRFAPDLGFLLDSEWTLAPTVAELFEPRALADGELRMMVSCASPQLAEDAQIALVLHILCGFSIAEVAAALLGSEAATEKRITRAKATIARSGTLFDLHEEAELSRRLPMVQRALYLLFNEGYHGASENSVRENLCKEALRLTMLLLDHPACARPSTHALAAVMCLHAARLPARIDAAGDLVPLLEQDRTRWDAALVSQGRRLLDLAATGDEVSEYHVEAAIAAVHADAARAENTAWREIVALYDVLAAMRPSPVVALARAIAVGQMDGPDAGLAALAALADEERLTRAPFYDAAVADLEWRAGRTERAATSYRAARDKARSTQERRFFEARLREKE